MPRIRTLKPEHRQHRKVGPLSHLSYRLWIGMICEADDHGRLVAEPLQLRATIFAYHPKVNASHIESALMEIESTGLIRTYCVGGTRYADFPSWTDHQKVEHPAKAKLPEYQHSENSLMNPHEDSRGLASIRGGSERKGKDQGKEWKGGEDTALPEKPATPPSAHMDRIAFQIPVSITLALDRAPHLGDTKALRTPGWWQAEIRANPGVNMATEILKAEAWITAHPEKHYRKLSNFLHNWLGRADRPLDGD